MTRIGTAGGTRGCFGRQVRKGRVRFADDALSSTALFRRFTLPEDGEYTIKVVATAPVSYVLRLDERPPDHQEWWRLVKLSLICSIPVAGETVPYHDWAFSAREGERVSISLRSSDFDTYLRPQSTARETTLPG